MRLHQLSIENFRAIDHIGDDKLDFTDMFSEPRNMTLIVGPNGAGKTSILDAIDVVVKTCENPSTPRFRNGLEFTAQQLVRGLGRDAKIDFSYSFSAQEAEQISSTYKALNYSFCGTHFPTTVNPVTSCWHYPSRYPDSKKTYDLSSPEDVAKVLGARGYVAQAIARNVIQHRDAEQVGGVCYIDQRRSFKISKRWDTNVSMDNTDFDDVLSWLYDYHSRHETWNAEKYGESYWSRIERLFNEVCYPAEFVRLESGPDGSTLVLKRDDVEYDLSQMSSGEHQILRILVALVAGRAINSIVLIDEIELHLHPAWQRKLVSVLRNEQDLNNQYIITTHSPFVKDLFSDDEIIDLGRLD